MQAKVIIFDMDYTLVYGEGASRYYARYSRAIEGIVTKELGLSAAQGLDLVNRLRKSNGGRGELSFNLLGIDESLWFDQILKLDPTIDLSPLPQVNQILNKLKRAGTKLVVLTDGPKSQIKRIAKGAQVDLSLFDQVYGWQRNQPKPKSTPTIYQVIANKFDCSLNQMWMIGDSYTGDILPAQSMGVKTILIKSTCPSNYDGINLSAVSELDELINGDLL